tara:strand:+ start:475 stop:780 length:306 start_codon:yes stop_codon:yes gene_type:complete
MENNNVNKNCGKKPSYEEFIEVGNDPNFVFQNDPNFNTLVLYDQEGNVVNVNSWLECATYVNGGWSISPEGLVNYEQYIFFGLTIALIIFVVINFSKKLKK